LLFSGQFVIFRANFFRPPSKMPSRTSMVLPRADNAACVVNNCQRVPAE